MKRLLAMLPLLLASLGCGGQETIPMQGKLIYTTNQGIHELDLSTRRDRVTRIESQSPRFYGIDRIDNTHFLVVTHFESKIQLLDRNTLQLREVIPGRRPAYMPMYRDFFYFYGPRLYLANLDNPAGSARQIAPGKGKFSSYAHVIPVSDDEVVFPIRGDAGKTPPYLYNLVADKLEQLPFIRPCTPYVWRSATQQLLCGIDGTGEHYLIGLDGQRSLPLDLSGLPSKTPLPLLYIPKYDVLILGVARMEWFGRHAGEHFDLWAYSFKDGRTEKLLEDNAPGRGGIVWVEK